MFCVDAPWLTLHVFLTLFTHDRSNVSRERFQMLVFIKKDANLRDCSQGLRLQFIRPQFIRPRAGIFDHAVHPLIAARSVSKSQLGRLIATGLKNCDSDLLPLKTIAITWRWSQLFGRNDTFKAFIKGSTDPLYQFIIFPMN